MFFTGKRDDLSKMIEKSGTSKFKKNIVTLLIAGSIISVTGNYAHAAGKSGNPAYRNQKEEQHTITYDSKKAIIDKEIKKMDEKRNTADYYENVRGYSKEDAKKQAKYDYMLGKNAPNKTFIDSLKVDISKNKNLNIRHQNNQKTSSKDNDRDER